MASPLLHLAALEKLARESEGLPAPLSRALVGDAEYGRFGVLLPDLPSFERPTTGLRELLGLRPNPPLFTRLLHGPRPMALLLKAAELVARGALVGRSAGQALLSGYLVHVALDRALDGQALRLADRLGWRHGGPNGAARRVAWLQSLFFLRERFGRVPLGDRELVDWMRVVKRRGMPWAGLGGGIFEITRLSLLEVYGQAPAKGQVDGWLRGLYLVSQLLGSPVGAKLGERGRSTSTPSGSTVARASIFPRRSSGLWSLPDATWWRSTFCWPGGTSARAPGDAFCSRSPKGTCSRARRRRARTPTNVF